MEKIARVCLIGPQSTGKTELARELAAHYRTQWVGEYAREYALAVQRELTADDVSSIAAGQIELEERARAAGLLILDTDLVSTVVYARFYYGSCPRWIEHQARARRADLYLLSDIDMPFIEDGVRDSAGRREELFAMFRTALEEHEARYVVIEGEWERRKDAAMCAIEGFLV